MKSTTTLILVLALVVGACSSNESTAESSSTSEAATSSTTTSTDPTTSTTAPMSIEGSTPELTLLIQDFYSYATISSTTAPPMPEEVLQAIAPAEQPAPSSGVASTATFAGSGVATVEVGDDVFLAVQDPQGWRIVGGEWPSLAVPGYYGSGPRLVAVIGSDARPGEDAETSRADSIHFVALDGMGTGAVVGLPRDSYVPVPGNGKRKITEALAVGGPDLLMESLTDLTSLPLEGYVLTGFAGFQDVVNAVLGGVEVTVPFAINDEKAKATLKAGQQLLNGFDALAFARARKTVPGGDFARSEHQGVILLGAARGVQGLGVGAIPGLMESAEPYLFTNLTAEQLLTFSALTVKSDLDSIPNVVAPGKPGTAGSASVVFLSDSAGPLFQDLADGQLGN